MSRTIESILAGSCTPAHDLLLQIRHYGMDAAAALRAYNARLLPRDRVVSLHDAAAAERAFEVFHDI